MSEKRTDYAKGASEKNEVLEIDKLKYEQIIKKTELSSGEKKIDFLMRYVPKLRTAAKSMIEEFEVFFIKEDITKGY